MSDLVKMNRSRRPDGRPSRPDDRKRASKRRRSRRSERSESPDSIVYVATYPSECLRKVESTVDLTKSDESLAGAERQKGLRTVYFSSRNFVWRFPRNVTSMVALPKAKRVVGKIARSRSDPSLEESACPDLLREEFPECCGWTDPGNVSWDSHGEEEEEDSVTAWN